jgi:superfamily I DNA/RNA helicase/mRNA-degrading endonuclease RelE of RelBE toxin-antitoxin system
MSFELIHKPTFTNQLLAIPKERVMQILEKVELLRDDPSPHGTVKKKLHGYRGDIYRLRSGDYRVIYTYGDGWVTLLGVDARKDVYKGEQLVADEPSVSMNAIPDVEAWLAPSNEPPASGPQHVRRRTAADDLPVRLTADLLARLLVPPQFVEPLCACRTFEDLFAAEVPDHLRERIFDCITSPNFDRVLSEPSYVTGTVENLLRFKEGELSAFLLRLSPEQDRYVTWGSRASGPTLLKGGPGTGKSTVALYRVRALLNSLLARGESPRILFTTYTNALVAASRQLLEVLLGENARYVDVRTADSLMMAIAGADIGGRKLASADNLRQAMAAALASVEFHGDHLQQRAQRYAIERLSPEYLLDEIMSVIEARRLTTVQQYLHAARPGRKVALNLTQRTALWRLREYLLRELEVAQCCTWQQLRAAAADRVARGDGPAPYDAVIIDEAQDLDPSALWTLVALCREPGQLFITADANQSIYGAGFRWSDVHERLQFRGRTGILRTNFRSTREIGEAAQAYLRSGVLDDEPLEREYEHSGPTPAMRRVRNADEEADLLRVFLPAAARSYHLGIGACAVLCPTERAARGVANALTSYGLPARYMSGHELDLREQVVKVLTLKSSKGLEFPIVALAGFVRGGYPGSSAVEDGGEGEELHERERRTLFVGMTRTMRALLVLCPRNSDSPLFVGFDPPFWNTKDG